MQQSSSKTISELLARCQEFLHIVSRRRPNRSVIEWQDLGEQARLQSVKY